MHPTQIDSNLIKVTHTHVKRFGGIIQNTSQLLYNRSGVDPPRYVRRSFIVDLNNLQGIVSL